MSLTTIAELVVALWVTLAYLLFALCWLNVPVLIVFICHRITQLRDREFHLRPTAPTHAALHFACALLFGIALPVFYFLSVRTRHGLAEWHLGAHTNTWWTIALGVACLVWLSTHFLEAALRLGRLHFGPSAVNRIFAALGLALCLWFHWHTVNAAFANRGVSPFTGGTVSLAEQWIFRILYPQSCFLGATLVFGFALIESFHERLALPGRRRWAIALPLAATLVLILFAPLWFSIPRVPHREAIALIESHRGEIVTTAEAADLDPRLLAGIIFVAQTRDHPRFTGDLLEELTLTLWDSRYGNPFGFGGTGAPLLNASAGLCQIRPTTALETISPIAGRGIWPGRRAAFPRPPFDDPHVNRVRTRCFALLPAIEEANRTGEIRTLLLVPKCNLAAAAILLCNFSEQWREAGFPIDDRPEILATLYNIGYQRSHPHGAPRANDFGRRVAEFMESEECRALFPEMEVAP
jgi:hypothetical protein